MKMANYYFKKSYELTIFMLLMPLVFVSCREEGKGMQYPEPSEDPIYLTSEAQTKDTWVKYMHSIGAENPKTDIVEFNNVQTETQNLWVKIHNDWITLDEGGTLPKEVIRITVKENTFPYSRSYVVTSHSALAETKIAIIQEGKKE